MKIDKIYTPKETITKLTSKDLKLGKKVLTNNMGLKSKESLLVVTDPKMAAKEAAIWFEAGKTITDRTHMVMFSGMTENAQEPPAIVALMMAGSDVCMLQTNLSLSHTKARLMATQNGARIASLPSTSYNIINRTLNIDYKPIAKLSTQVAKKLTQATKATITAPNGTNLSLSLKGRSAIDDTGFFTHPGDFGNLPAGEAFIAPVEGSSNGIFIVDASFADINLDKPITIKIKNGNAQEISGGKAAKKLKSQLKKVGKKANNIAELGVGTNPQANAKGLLIEAEKAYGTIHIALGNNAFIGGKISVPFHSDGVVLHSTLKLDNKIILKNGNFSL